MAGGARPFAVAMQNSNPPPEAAALLAFIAETLQKHLERDGNLQAACVGLQRAGFSLGVRVAALPGEGRPRVAVEGKEGPMPQWTPEDRELLRSLGIAGEGNDKPQRSPQKSPWRQPR